LAVLIKKLRIFTLADLVLLRNNSLTNNLATNKSLSKRCSSEEQPGIERHHKQLIPTTRLRFPEGVFQTGQTIGTSLWLRQRTMLAGYATALALDHNKVF